MPEYKNAWHGASADDVVEAWAAHTKNLDVIDVEPPEEKHLWEVFIDDMTGKKMIVTDSRDMREVLDVCEKHGYTPKGSVKYAGQALA